MIAKKINASSLRPINAINEALRRWAATSEMNLDRVYPITCAMINAILYCKSGRPGSGTGATSSKATAENGFR